MRALACLAVLLLVADAASAQTFVLARLAGDGVDASLMAQLDAGLRSEAAKVLGPRLFAVAPSGCAHASACASGLAREAGAERVLLARVEPHEGAGQALHVRLYDATGRQLAEARRASPTVLDVAALRGIAVQLLDPAAYVGRLVLGDVPADAQVLVDGIPLAAEELQRPIPLSVGEHVVEVNGRERLLAPRAFEVRFGVDTPLTVGAVDVSSPALGRAAGGGPALWPGLLAAAVSGGAFLAGVGFAVDYACMRRCDEDSLDPVFAKFEPTFEGNAHTHAGKLSSRAHALSRQRAALGLDAIGMVASGAVFLSAGAAATALLVNWALWSEPEEES
jgi:hypothetical protein